jgi:hypothetical protein
MFDGHAEFRFGKIWLAPAIVTSRFKSETHEDIKEDELFLVIYENSCSEFNGINTNPGICYVLTPNKESFDERRLEIYKYFKSHIVSAYVRLLMRKHDEDEASRWRWELMHKSDMLLGMC